MRDNPGVEPPHRKERPVLLQLLVILAVVSLVLFGWHYYLWARLVRDTALPAPWRTAATAAVVVLGASIPAAFVVARVVAPQAGRWLHFAAYGWMGLGFLLMLGLGAGELVRLGHAGALWATGRGPADPERRLALVRGIAAVVVLAAGAASGIGVRTALGAAKIRRVRVPLARLPRALSGTTIAHVTDVHAGLTVSPDFVRRIVQQVNALRPDLVAVTGDLVDGTVEQLRAHVEPLRELEARWGVYFVTGNHEYYSGVEAWMRALPALGVRVLRNERVSVGTAEASFELAGVDDWTAAGHARGHGHDLGRALAGIDPGREVVLLAHQPRSAREAAARGVGLQLSGHTHGGQIFPWNLAVCLQQPFVSGLHRLRDTFVYVSRGAGYWGPPMRIGAPPEITLIEMVSAADTPEASAATLNMPSVR
jgi:predicted MPP superfamily phosphohydrolase